MDLCDLPALEIARRVRSGETRAVEVLEATFARIKAVEGRSGSLDFGSVTPEDETKVHGYISLAEESAYQAAEETDRRAARGEDPGLLAGVPVSIKDIFCVRGANATAGSRILASFRAPYNATPVERMQAQGAVVVGKANLDEFTYGSSNESSAFQPATRNPWDTSRVPGGSSGGSAATVAAGEAFLSLGTDTAGSIRQPAAFCGVVGMKPTYGRVSRYGLIAFASSLDCPGPVARSVTDAALMLQVIAGEDSRDATSAREPVPDYLAGINEDLGGLRIGLSPDYFQITYPDPASGEFLQQPVPDEIRNEVLRAADLLARQGAEIIENVPMPNTRYGIPAYFVVSRVEAASNLHRYDGVKYGFRTNETPRDLKDMYRKTRAQGFGLQPKLRILMGMYVSAAQYSEQYYMRALKVRSLIRGDFDRVFDPAGSYRLDAVLTPTTPTPAFPMNAVYGDSVLMQYADQLTVPANHAGIPGISIPAGLSQGGLPLAVQLLGPDFSEGNLLKIGRAYERATADDAWRQVRPAVLRTPDA